MKIEKKVGWLLLAVGIVLALIGIVPLAKEKHEYRDHVIMEEEIVWIAKGTTHTGKEWRRAEIIYELNGESIYGNLNKYERWMDIGDTVSFYVNPQKPEYVYYKESRDTEEFLSIAGLFVSAVGIVLIIVQVMTGKERKLRKKGMCVRAVVVGVEDRTHIGKKTRQKLVCRYEDAFGLERRVFFSEDFFGSIGYVAMNPTAYTVNVYVDMFNPDNYFVDVKSLQGTYVPGGDMR